MYIVVAYDISEDRRRTRLANILEGFGERVQYSLFECDLEEKHFARLLRQLTQFMEPGDQIRIYRLPRADERHLLVLGGLPPVRRPKLIIV